MISDYVTTSKKLLNELGILRASISDMFHRKFPRDPWPGAPRALKKLMGDKCCGTCYHWDQYKRSGPLSKHGGCREVCKSVFPDQSCNFDMMVTNKEFWCIHYKIK